MRLRGLLILLPLTAVGCGGDDSSGGGGGSSGNDASVGGSSGAGSGGTDAGVGGGSGGNTGGLGGTAGGGAGSGGAAGSGGSGGSSGGGAGGTGGSGGVTLDCLPFVNVTAQDACVAFGDALCDSLAQCAPLFFDYLAVASEAECSSRFHVVCHQILNAPSANVKPAFFAAYADLVNTSLCVNGQQGEFEVPTNISAECGTYGSLADGKQCFVDAQCAGTECVIPENALCGTCGHGALGSTCFTDSDCGDALYCTAANTCVARAMVGQSCATAECLETAFCNTGNLCAQKGAVGATCTTTEGCEENLVCGTNGQCKTPAKGKLGANCNPTDPGSCDVNFDLFCGPGSVCTQHVAPGPGAPCGFFAGDAGLVFEFVCSGGARCVIPSGQADGTCVITAADGASCDLANGPHCKMIAECVANKCVVADATTCPPN